MRFEELGDSKTVLAVSLHSNVEGCETSVDEVTVKRRWYSSNSKLGKHELLFELVGFHSKETHHDVRVTIHVLCGRVHNNIGSEVKRSLKYTFKHLVIIKWLTEL